MGHTNGCKYLYIKCYYLNLKYITTIILMHKYRFKTLVYYLTFKINQYIKPAFSKDPHTMENMFGINEVYIFLLFYSR